MHRVGWGTMNEEEQFVNIDLNDNNNCSVYELGTDKKHSPSAIFVLS